MQSNLHDEVNPDTSSRQKEGRNLSKKGHQDDLKDESTTNNPPQLSKKKEFMHDHQRVAATRKEIHHREQDLEDDEPLHPSKPSKKIHLESKVENSNPISNKPTTEDTPPAPVKMEDVMASLNSIMTKKNMVEELSKNPLQSKPKTQPISYKIPEQDIINIRDFVLDFQGPIENLLQTIFGNIAENQIYNLGLNNITFPTDEEGSADESDLESGELGSGSESIKSVY